MCVLVLDRFGSFPKKIAATVGCVQGGTRYSVVYEEYCNI